MREHFWRTYGTTLDGLMRHHSMHPRHFLAETHVFPELAGIRWWISCDSMLRHSR